MGYSHYDFNDGEGPRGYAVEDTCHHPECKKKIDRGLAYLCHSCTMYFCGEHLTFSSTEFDCFAGKSTQCCLKCEEEFGEVETDEEEEEVSS